MHLEESSFRKNLGHNKTRQRKTKKQKIVFLKVKANINIEATKKKARERMRIRPPALLVKPEAGKPSGRDSVKRQSPTEVKGEMNNKKKRLTVLSPN